jgi:hypothetical protein
MTFKVSYDETIISLYSNNQKASVITKKSAQKFSLPSSSSYFDPRWYEGQITYSEYVKSIECLVNQGITKFK